MIYTNQRSKLTKKQKARQSALLKEQRAIREELRKIQSDITMKVVSRNQLPADRNTDHIPSRDSGIGFAAARSAPTYTGDKMIGIGQMHKSNAVPVFREEDAKDLATMRR